DDLRLKWDKARVGQDPGARGTVGDHSPGIDEDGDALAPPQEGRLLEPCEPVDHLVLLDSPPRRGPTTTSTASSTSSAKPSRRATTASLPTTLVRCGSWSRPQPWRRWHLDASGVAPSSLCSGGTY